jgi:predicted DNA-binding transcriptional regulator AlpA
MAIYQRVEQSTQLAFSVAQVCALIGCSRAWLYGLFKDGNGPKRVKINGRVFIVKADLLIWLGCHYV